MLVTLSKAAKFVTCTSSPLNLDQFIGSVRDIGKKMSSWATNRLDPDQTAPVL